MKWHHPHAYRIGKISNRAKASFARAILGLQCERLGHLWLASGVCGRCAEIKPEALAFDSGSGGDHGPQTTTPPQ